VPVLTKNGTEAETTNRKPPSGPATILPISVVPPISQPFACSRRSLGTTSGVIAWLADLNTTSPVLMTKRTASSSAMLDQPPSSATDSTPIATTRLQSMRTIVRRRSTRSMRTPPGSANSSQGSQATPVVADMSSGLLVCAATYSGAAIVAIPLPSADVVLAVQSFANRPPRGSVMIRLHMSASAQAAEPELSRKIIARRKESGRETTVLFRQALKFRLNSGGWPGGTDAGAVRASGVRRGQPGVTRGVTAQVAGRWGGCLLGSPGWCLLGPLGWVPVGGLGGYGFVGDFQGLVQDLEAFG
jgi:hypothetical protein